jgi:hypothetical protein
MSTSFPDAQVPHLSPAQRSFARKVLFFDAMLTPKIITFVYWLMLLGCTLSGLVAMFTVPRMGFIVGLAILVGGAIGARIWCELLIVLFKINEHTQHMAERP